MTLGQRIRAGVAWLMLGNTGSEILSFLFGIALARLLVPADFGMIATIHILTGVVSLISSGGMALSLVRARQVDAQDFNVVFTIQLGLAVLICAGTFAIAPWFARFFENPLYVDLLVISALNFLLRPFALIRSAWLNREMLFKASAIVNLASTFVTQIASVSMAAAGMGVWSLSLGGLIAAFTTNVMLYRLTPLRLKLRFDAQVARRHAAFGFNMTALELIDHVNVQATSLILSKLVGPQFLGLFNKAKSLARMPNHMITPAVGKVLFRALSTVSHDLDQSKYMCFRTITLLSVYIFPALVAFIWVAEPLIVFLYGEKWAPTGEPAQIIAIAGFFLTSSRPCYVLLEAQNRLRPLMAIAATLMVVSVVACLIGLRWGLAGVAWSAVLGSALNFILLYIVVCKTIAARVSDLARAVAPALMLNGLLFIVLAALHFQIATLRASLPFAYLAAMGGVGGVVYVCAFMLLPIQALETEVARWRARASRFLAVIRLHR